MFKWNCTIMVNCEVGEWRGSVATKMWVTILPKLELPQVWDSTNVEFMAKKCTKVREWGNSVIGWLNWWPSLSVVRPSRRVMSVLKSYPRSRTLREEGSKMRGWLKQSGRISSIRCGGIFWSGWLKGVLGLWTRGKEIGGTCWGVVWKFVNLYEGG